MLLPEPLPLLRRRPAPLLADLGRHLTPALARLGALLGGHAPPAFVVLHDALALVGRHRFPLAVPLEDALAPFRGKLLETLVGFLQFLLPRGGELGPALEVVKDPRLLVRSKPPRAPEH